MDGTIPHEMQDKYLNIILFETERLNKLTQSMLELNKYGAKGTMLDISSFDINNTIKLVVQSFEGTCQEKKISFELILTGHTSFVWADMSKIQQVLYNLIDNAIKFSNPDSTITIETTEKNEKVFISVKDTGIGIPKVMIDGEEYVDGMYADNVPIELLETIHPDASRIVVIDLHDPGEMVPPALTREMFYIQPLLQPGNPLDFSTEHAEALYSQGYLETKKYLGKYAGYLYTFPLDDQPLIDVVEEYIGAQITQMKVVLPDIKDLSDHLYRQALGYVPPELPNSQQEHYYFGRMVEALALMAKINPIALRDYRQFLEEIKDRLDHLSVMDRNPEEFLLVNLLSNVSREEVPIQMYRLLKNNNGHFPERIESLKDRFPTSYTMAVIRYCLDLLLEALNPQPEKEPEEAQSAKQAASDNETAGQETEESEASDQENTDMAGEENANSSPAKPENAQSAVSDKADSSNKPNLDSGCLMTCEAQTRKSAETEAKSEPKLPPLPEQEEDEVPIGAVCIVEEADRKSVV